jgi:16S rRNA pseudouridine516 synthase
MFAAAGNHVLDLKRISIGGLEMPEDLEEGGWRELEPEQVQSIFI